MSELLTRDEYAAIAAELAPPTDAWIDGTYRPAASGRTLETRNPATGAVLGHLAACGAEDVDLAVRRSREAFERGDWSRMHPGERKQIMVRLCKLLQRNRHELAVLESLDSGKPIRDCATIDVPETIQCILWHAEAIDKIYDQTAPVGDDAMAMIDRDHYDKVCRYIETARAEGAKALLDGGPEPGGEGLFIRPTIFGDVEPTAAVAREEIFGPVLALVSVGSNEQAIALANDTPYGLAASVFSRDVKRALRAARSIRAGTVTVNCYGEGDITTPFGGYRQSGFGGRDNSLHAHDQYTEIKTIWVDLTDRGVEESLD